MPKIQLALDTLSAETALELARLTAPYVDILEAGTPLIKSAGIGIVSRLKIAYPDKLVLADLKSSDVGAYEAAMAFRAGADIVTTQGINNNAISFCHINTTVGSRLIVFERKIICYRKSQKKYIVFGVVCQLLK